MRKIWERSQTFFEIRCRSFFILRVGLTKNSKKFRAKKKHENKKWKLFLWIDIQVSIFRVLREMKSDRISSTQSIRTEHSLSTPRAKLSRRTSSSRLVHILWTGNTACRLNQAKQKTKWNVNMQKKENFKLKNFPLRKIANRNFFILISSDQSLNIFYEEKRFSRISTCCRCSSEFSSKV